MGVAWAVHCARQGREARRLLRRSQTEAVVRWSDRITRIRCKARPDIVRDGLLADIKTTGSVDARRFGRLAADMLYHGKMAFARLGLEELGHRIERTAIIAVEQKPPHDVAVFDIDPGDLDASEAMVCGLLATLKRCRRNRSWPGRCANTQLLQLPPWTFGSDDYDISEIGLELAPKGA